MKAEILCVGTELLLGDIVNTNAAFLSQKLAEAGVGVYRHTVIGDNPKRLKDALEEAFSRADAVIMTGGLGPTYDDLTKETVAEYFGLGMVMDESIKEDIANYFGTRCLRMPHNNLKQAMIPEGAKALYNKCGTAPGIMIEKGGKIAVLLPGPPVEMQPMFENEVLPEFKKLTGTCIVSHNVHIMGLGESMVEEMLREKMMEYTNPTIAPYAKAGEVRLRVTASAPTEAEADALISPILDEICALMGDYVYAIDAGDIEHALVKELQERELKIAAAESCTGGLISKLLTDVPGASDVLDCSFTTYSNAMKQQLLGVREETLAAHGAVSEETAREMAEGVKKVSGADIGIGITGIAGPGGGTEEKPVGLVYVGIASENETEVLKLNWGSRSRAQIREMSANRALRAALNVARRLTSK